MTEVAGDTTTTVAVAPTPSGLRRIAANTAVYAAADLVAKGGAYALIPILTRGLAEAAFGAYTLVISFVAVLTIVGTLGLGGAVTRLWFDLDPAGRRRFHTSAWLALQASALGVALLLTGLSGPLFRALFPRIPPSLFLYGVWTSFFLASATVPLAVLRAEEKARRFAVLSASQFLGPAVGVVVAVALGAGVRGALAGYLAGAAFVFVLSLWFLRPLASVPADWGMVRPALALGLPVVPHLVAHWALNVVDRVAIQRSLGAAAVGLYAVGYQIAQGVSLIASAANNAMVPTFYRAAQRGRREAIGRAWAPILFGLGALALAVSLFGEEAVSIIAPRSYAATAAFIPWVALGYWLLAGYYFPVNALFYAKRVKAIPIATAVAAVVNFVANTIMLPRYGLIAAAWNTAISYGVLLVIVMIVAQRVMPLPYGLTRAALLGGLGSGLYALSTALPEGIAGTALKLPLLGVYLAGGWLLVRADFATMRALGRMPPSAPVEPSGTEPVPAGSHSRVVVLAAETATQARTMVAVADALDAAGFEPRFASLDPLAGKSASAGFAGAGVEFVEVGTAVASERSRIARLLRRGRAEARALLEDAAAVVVGNDFTPFARLLIDEARRAGIASVLVQDGVIALDGDQVGAGAKSGSLAAAIAKRVLPLLGFPFEPKPYGAAGCDAVCVYGPSTARALVARGVPETSIRLTGQPRYDAPAPKVRPAGPRRAKKGIVLVATQPFSRYGLADAASETALFRRMIENALEHGGGRDVVVKLHPDTDAESRGALETAAASRARFEQLRPIEELLGEADAIVTLSSTTALEAMIHSVPVVVVDAPGFPTTLPYLDSGAVEPARSAEEIGPALARALKGGDDRATEREAFLAEHCAPLDGRAAVRVAAAVLGVVARLRRVR